MKNIKHYIIVGLIISSMLFLTACGEKGDIKKTIAAFESACQSADVEAVLDCFTPEVASTTKLALNVVGVDINEQFVKLLSLVGMFDFASDEPSEVLKTIAIKPSSYEFNDNKDKCTVSAVMTYEVDGSKKDMDIKLKFKKVDDEWCMTLL